MASNETSSPLGREYSADPAKVGTYTLLAVVLTAFASLAMYNSIELLVLIFTTFKKYQGLYFWSITVAALGALPYTIGGFTEFYLLGPRWLANFWDCAGWLMLVVNQSVVLYSRLHFVVDSRRILLAVKWMIIFNSIVFGTLAILFDYLFIYNIPAGRISNIYAVITKTQMTVFCSQEFVISCLYMWKVTEMLKGGSKAQSRKTLIELLVVNGIIILMDVGILTLEYVNIYDLMLAVKSFVYTVKLKLEFAVLGKLVDMAQNHVRRTHTSATSDLEGSDESFRIDMKHSSPRSNDLSRTDTFGSNTRDFSESRPRETSTTLGAISEKPDRIESCDSDERYLTQMSEQVSRDSEDQTYEDILREMSYPNSTGIAKSPTHLSVARSRTSGF